MAVHRSRDWSSVRRKLDVLIARQNLSGVHFRLRREKMVARQGGKFDDGLSRLLFQLTDVRQVHTRLEQVVNENNSLLSLNIDAVI